MITLKREDRIISKSVKDVRELFERNGIDLSSFELKYNLKVVGWDIPQSFISQQQLRKIISSRYGFVSQLQQTDGSIVVYRKDKTKVTLTITTGFKVIVQNV